MAEDAATAALADLKLLKAELEDHGVLEDLRLQAAAARLAQAGVVELVGKARLEGRSWAEIGAALGMTKQAAHQRFGRSTGCPQPAP